MAPPYCAVTTEILLGVDTAVTVELVLEVGELPLPPQPDNVPVSAQIDNNNASFFMSRLLV
jgi:hypothetical protein